MDLEGKQRVLEVPEYKEWPLGMCMKWTGMKYFQTTLVLPVCLYVSIYILIQQQLA